MLWKVLTCALAAVVCVAVARGASGQRGFHGALVGAGAGMVLCVVNALILLWAQRAEGKDVLRGMYGSMVASLVLVLATFFILSSYYREILQPALITMLVVYLSFRFLDVFRVSSRSRDPGGKSSGEGASRGASREAGA